MAKSNLKLVSPAKVNRTVTPRQRLNSELQPREHLTEREVEKLIEAANRHGQRDSHNDPANLQAWLVGFGIMRASME